MARMQTSSGQLRPTKFDALFHPSLKSSRTRQLIRQAFAALDDNSRASRHDRCARELPNVALSKKRRDIARTLLFSLITFSVIWGLTLCEWMQAGDDALRSAYYNLSPERNSAHRVLLLVADGPTPQTTTPSWTLPELRKALRTLTQGNPSLVVLVDPERSFSLSPAEVEHLVQDPKWHNQVVAASSNTANHPGARGLTHLKAQAMSPAHPHANILEAVSERIAQSRVHQGPLPIHYLSARKALASIPLSTLLSSDSQLGGFQGNIILIGKIHDLEPIPTPIGAMSPVEVHAHGLAGLVDGAAWAEPSKPAKLIFLLGFILAWTWHLRRRETPGSLRHSLVLSLVLIGIDWLLFSRSILLWGPCSTLAALWLAQFLVVRDALTTISDKMGYLQTRLAEMLPDAIASKKQVQQDPINDAFWQDLVDFGRAYVKFDFEGMLAELPDREWHIQIRACTGSSIQHIAEKRRDIRRAPFRAPFLTQKCGWTKNFINSESFAKSMVVPLHHEAKLYGYWLLHMREDQPIEDKFLRTCEGIGRQMAALIAEKRGQIELNEKLASNRAQHAIQEVERDVQRLERDRNWAMELIEQDSDAKMLASLWGPIELMNQSMRERMQLIFPSGIPDNDLRAVVAKLCSGSETQVRALMRSAVVDDLSVPIPRGADEDETFIQGDFSYRLRAIEIGTKNSEPRDVPNMHRVRLLLVAKNRYTEPHPLPAESVVSSPQPPSANDIAPPIENIEDIEGPATLIFHSEPESEPLAAVSDEALIQPGAPAHCDIPNGRNHFEPLGPELGTLDSAPAPINLYCIQQIPEQRGDDFASVPLSPELQELCSHAPPTSTELQELPCTPAPLTLYSIVHGRDEPIAYYDDGWEDWTPTTQLTQDEDRSLLFFKRTTGL